MFPFKQTARREQTEFYSCLFPAGKIKLFDKEQNEVK